MAVLLALCSALSYGLSDFVGGVLARRTSAWSVAVVGQTSSFLCIGALAFVVDGRPAPEHFAWALLAGAGGGTALKAARRGASDPEPFS